MANILPSYPFADTCVLIIYMYTYDVYVLVKVEFIYLILISHVPLSVGVLKNKQVKTTSAEVWAIVMI